MVIEHLVILHVLVGYLTRKNLSPIWPIMCLVGHKTLLYSAKGDGDEKMSGRWLGHKPGVDIPATGYHHFLASSKLYCSVIEVRVGTSCPESQYKSGGAISQLHIQSFNRCAITLLCLVKAYFVVESAVYSFVVAAFLGSWCDSSVEGEDVSSKK